MPKKYIKDGAYTIVIDEEPSPSSSKKSRQRRDKMASRSHSWQSVGSMNSGKSKRSKGMSGKELSVSPRPIYDEDDSDDSSLGSSQAGEFEDEEEVEFGEDEDDELEIPPEEEEEEEIDYTDKHYILQNLNIATPDFEEDKTYMIYSRTDFCDMLCSQVRFYTYCAMQVFLTKPRTAAILVIGEGYMGSHVVQNLASMGLRDYIHVYTRGDLTALEWRELGVKAATTLPKLMGPQKPDIIIYATENASFPIVCNQLKANHLLQPNTFVINCTFGLGRRKLYRNLGTPSIFRTYLEPQGIVRGYKSRAYRALQAFAQGGQDYLMSNIPFVAGDSEANTPQAGSRPDTGHGQQQAEQSMDTLNSPLSARSPSKLNASHHSKLSSGTNGSRPNSSTLKAPSIMSGNPPARHASEMSVDASMDPSRGERSAAAFIARRSVDIRMVICILENYFALHDNSFAFSRRLALKCVFGYSDGREMKDDHYTPANSPLRHHHTLNMSEEAKERKKRKYEAKMTTRYQNIIANLEFTAQIYQDYFKMMISSDDFFALAEEEFHDPTFTTVEEEQALLATSTHSTHTIGNATGDASPSVSASSAGINHHTHEAIMQKMKDQKKNKNKPKEWHHMYEESSLISIYANDDNYSSYIGPGFDLMAEWDGIQRINVEESTISHTQSADQILRNELKEDSEDGYAHFVGQVSEVSQQNTKINITSSGINLETGEIDKDQVDDRHGLEMMQKFAAENAQYFHSRRSASKHVT